MARARSGQQPRQHGAHVGVKHSVRIITLHKRFTADSRCQHGAWTRGSVSRAAPTSSMFHVPGKYTGGEGPGYAWTQTQSEVELRAPLPAGAEGSVRCTFSARKLALSWADAAAPLDAELSALVAPDDCLWSIEEEAGAKTVVVSLRKQVKAVWSRLLESDAEPAEAPRLIDGAERSTPKTKAELLADAKARAKGALDEELGKAKLHMVEGRSGEVITLTAAEMPALPVLYIKRCDDCEVELKP